MSVTYFLFTYMYVKVCTTDVQFTDGYIYFMECTDISEHCTYTDEFFWSSFLILPCWLACRQVLAAIQVLLFASIQVQALV
jgi:hypothetical protein